MMKCFIRRYMNGEEGSFTENERNSLLFTELSRYVPRQSVFFTSPARKREFMNLCDSALSNMLVCVVLLLLL